MFVLVSLAFAAPIIAGCAEDKCAREDMECRAQCRIDRCGDPETMDFKNISLSDISNYFSCTADANIDCIDTDGKCAKEDLECANQCIKAACGDLSETKIGDFSLNKLAEYNKCKEEAKKTCIEQ